MEKIKMRLKVEKIEITTTYKAKVKDLRQGDRFRISNRHKLKCVERLIELDSLAYVPDHHKGKMLIVLSDCRQLVIDPELEVIIEESPF